MQIMMPENCYHMIAIVTFLEMGNCLGFKASNAVRIDNKH